jgi:hypothetical protein
MSRPSLRYFTITTPFLLCAILAACAAPPPTAAPSTTIPLPPSTTGAPSTQPAPITPTIAPRPSGIVAKVTLAEDVKGELAEPVNPTGVFKPGATFHAIVTINNAKAATKFRAVWYVVDVGSAALPDTLIDQAEVTTEGSRNLDFFLQPAQTWPVGTYRVEIFVNEVLEQVVSFSVK